MSTASVATSTLSSSSKRKYDVFLSLCHEDTGNTFTSHLYAALGRKGIAAYFDDTLQLHGGCDEISPEPKNAIAESMISVVVLSKNYAHSSQCLDELMHILQCKKIYGHIVLPVFYHVDPSTVQKQTGEYGRGLAVLEERFKNKVPEWKTALTEVANLTGWDSVDRFESELVEDIVNSIMEELNYLSLGLVGVAKQVESIESILDTSSLGVHSLGICGAAGVGKTTLARVVFDRLSAKFDACCFLANDGEEREKKRFRLPNKEKARFCLRNKLLNDLLKEEPAYNKGMASRKCYANILQRKKVLIILDGIYRWEQLELVFKDGHNYGEGSRIIITSRNLELLECITNKVYTVSSLYFDEALRLLKLQAYRLNSFSMDNIEFSKKVVNFASGLPLAIKVLGSCFCAQQSIEKQEKMHKIFSGRPSHNIQDILRISYDELDDNEKIIFLDIACFFKGDDKGFAERILYRCRSFGDQEIERLILKSLITILDNKLWMHDLIQDMGRELVVEQSPEKPGQRSRLWDAEDVCHVFKNNTGSGAVEGIFLDMSKVEKLALCPTAFSEMLNLKILKLHNHFAKCMLQFPQGLDVLPNSLVYLYWDDFPLKSLPPDFTGENLVEFKMQYSKVERLWKEVKGLENLKVIDLGFSKKLIEIPDLSLALGIESVCLRGCELLLEVPSYFQDLVKLHTIDLEDCSSLERVLALPPNIVDVNLTRCESLEILPRNISSLKSLACLELSGCSKIDQHLLNNISCLKSSQGLKGTRK